MLPSLVGREQTLVTTARDRDTWDHRDPASDPSTLHLQHYLTNPHLVFHPKYMKTPSFLWFRTKFLTACSESDFDPTLSGARKVENILIINGQSSEYKCKLINLKIIFYDGLVLLYHIIQCLQYPIKRTTFLETSRRYSCLIMFNSLPNLMAKSMVNIDSAWFVLFF